MADVVVNMFRLSNRRGYSCPPLNIAYIEMDTANEWRLTCGGTRAYFVRVGNSLVDNFDRQAADSHFMAQRMTGSLLIGGAGLFHAEAAGRLIFHGIEDSVTWSTHMDRPDPLTSKEETALAKSCHDWFRALCQHHILRRAVHDAYLALANPHEALVFVYRGLEWLKTGQNTSWDNIAKDLGIPLKELREFKRFANYETGVRHATSSGKKVRADFDTYGTWVCGLFDAINATRARLEKGFKPMTSKDVADAVARAVSVIPYP